MRRFEIGDDLTERELEIITLIAKGHTNEEIGKRLWLSTNTVKSHLRRITQKMVARNRAHVVGIAAEKGLLNGNEKPG